MVSIRPPAAFVFSSLPCVTDGATPNSVSCFDRPVITGRVITGRINAIALSHPEFLDNVVRPQFSVFCGSKRMGAPVALHGQNDCEQVYFLVRLIVWDGRLRTTSERI